MISEEKMKRLFVSVLMIFSASSAPAANFLQLVGCGAEFQLEHAGQLG